MKFSSLRQRNKNGNFFSLKTDELQTRRLNFYAKRDVHDTTTANHTIYSYI